MWLRCVIPAVSMTTELDGTAASKTTTVHFARKLGLALIKNVELEIGGQTIDKHYGDWMNIWNELSLPKSKQSGYSKLVGDGDLAKNDIGVVGGDKRYEQFTYGGFSSAEYMGTGGTAGSIPAQEVNVPLEFWFCRNPGLALPLIALQYHEVKVNFEMNQGRYLGMISQTATDTAATGPATQSDTVTIGSNTQTISVTTFGNGSTAETRALFSDTLVSLSSCSLWVDYIYLDTDERRRFAQTSHEYLIEQLQYAGQEEFSATNITAKLHFNHPVKEIMWVAQPSNNLTETTLTQTAAYDTGTISAYTNATTFTIDSGLGTDAVVGYTIYVRDVTGGGTAYDSATIATYTTGTGALTLDAPGINGFTADTSSTYTIVASDIANTSAVTNLSHGQFDYQFYPTTSDSVQDTNHIALRVAGTAVYPINPVVNAKLQLNGHDRTAERTGDYYNLIQPCQHHTRIPHDRGINVYSFALKPEEHQPSGTCNFSRIDVAELKMTLRNSDTHKVRIYAMNYNVLRIMSGMGGLAFAN
jgi:hypothetical protein